MLPCPAPSPTNVPGLGNDRKLRPYDPTYVLADLRDEISLRTHRWVPHSKTSPNAAYIRFLIIVCMAHVCAYVGVYKYVCTSDFWGGRSSCCFPLALLRQVCQSCYSCVPFLGWVPFVFELGSGFASLMFQWDSWKIAVSIQQSIL